MGGVGRVDVVVGEGDAVEFDDAGGAGVVEVVGAAGVGTGASDATGDSWVGGKVTGALGLQPRSTANIKNTARKPCFMIVSGFL